MYGRERVSTCSVANRGVCPSMAYVIHSSSGDWEVVIGLEVHAQVISRAKLFSGAAADFGAEPNSQVSLVDAAFPGMLARCSTGFASSRPYEPASA